MATQEDYDRYSELVDRKHLGTLSPDEERELFALRDTLDETEKSFFQPILEKLGRL